MCEQASFAQRVTAIRLLEVAQLWRISKARSFLSFVRALPSPDACSHAHRPHGPSTHSPSPQLTALFGVLLFSAPVLIGVAAIGSYSLAGGPLTAGRLYTALATFNLIRFPLVFLPFSCAAGWHQQTGHTTLSRPPSFSLAPTPSLPPSLPPAAPAVVVQLLNAKVALERLTVFLTAEEAEPAEDPAADGALPRGAVRVTGPASFHYPVPRPKPDEGKGAKGKGAKGGGGGGGGAHQPPAAAPEPAAAAVPEGAVAVDPSPPPTPFALTNVALDIAPGSLVMVIGPVGSGKSTLLAALNRYLVRDGGAVALGGTRALAAQTAWVLGATVEANVLFGAPMEPKARWQRWLWRRATHAAAGPTIPVPHRPPTPTRAALRRRARRRPAGAGPGRAAVRGPGARWRGATAQRALTLPTPVVAPQTEIGERGVTLSGACGE